MSMADGICHMCPRNHATNQVNIYIYIQPVQYQSARTGQLYNCYIQQLYILGHKEFACKPIYNISINGLVIYNKGSRESLKITKSTVGHDTVPFYPYR